MRLRRLQRFNCEGLVVICTTNVGTNSKSLDVSAKTLKSRVKTRLIRIVSDVVINKVAHKILSRSNFSLPLMSFLYFYASCSTAESTDFLIVWLSWRRWTSPLSPLFHSSANNRHSRIPIPIILTMALSSEGDQ